MLFLHKNICCGYSLETHGATYMYLNQMTYYGTVFGDNYFFFLFLNKNIHVGIH